MSAIKDAVALDIEVEMPYCQLFMELQCPQGLHDHNDVRSQATNLARSTQAQEDLEAAPDQLTSMYRLIYIYTFVEISSLLC